MQDYRRYRDHNVNRSYLSYLHTFTAGTPAVIPDLISPQTHVSPPHPHTNQPVWKAFADNLFAGNCSWNRTRLYTLFMWKGFCDVCLLYKNQQCNSVWLSPGLSIYRSITRMITYMLTMITPHACQPLYRSKEWSHSMWFIMLVPAWFLIYV